MELVALNMEDCEFGKDGLTITLRRSKTDQDGVGRKIGNPYGSIPRRARSERFRLGWNKRRPPPAHCSVPSPAIGNYGRDNWRVSK